MAGPCSETGAAPFFGLHTAEAYAAPETVPRSRSTLVGHRNGVRSKSPSYCSKSKSPSQRTSRKPLRVGCALLPKKVSRYLTPYMLETAARHGVELCLIDPKVPLAQQDPFDAILHKLQPDAGWERNLKNYIHMHPDVTVIDRLEAIRTLRNRATMLTPLYGKGIVVNPTGTLPPTSSPPGGEGRCTTSAARQGPVHVQAPTQVYISEGTGVSEAQQLLEDAGLHPPLLVKPLWTDGREGSHGLAVLYDLQGLHLLMHGNVSAELKPPLVVQQFVEHGGVLYKIYVLGEETVVTRRPSLGEKYMRPKETVQPLPRISCTKHYRPQHEGGPSSSPVQQAASPLCPPVAHTLTSLAQSPCARDPPEWLTSSLAAALRQRLGMQLFNFDMICPDVRDPGTVSDTYYVVDINYFPGVDKIPNFEQRFVKFLIATCRDHQRSRQLGGGV